ncbi:type I secretion system permease/ATPase [Falsirhodobacter algicola]|uniref:Type I secretion system permease/ATPase n=1 Tax=Falsirhodobacter algicola TaxID=2692330 RepID=A0A8J8MSK1_9RHOB|nr:type I secretion system permease/ATPase [Falsirhodobacter algicola]QUS35955.1 type I secretion system permease/ATPase [Falsirhodobacter algicola]
MRRTEDEAGRAELRRALRPARSLILTVALFSLTVNMLMLTGPLYMLQVYDRVLAGRSEATLLALSLIAAAMFLAMALIDHARGRIVARIGAALQQRLDLRVFRAALARSARVPSDGVAATAQRDLEAVQKLLASPVFLAMCDLPWVPIFVLGLFAFHPALGLLALGGAGLLVAMTLANQALSVAPLAEAARCGVRADRLSDMLKAEAETVQALGMTGAAFDRWQRGRSEALAAALRAADVTGGFGAAIRTLRLFLQSATLGLGAWLVLKAGLSGGVMIASSVLMGRALAPIDTAIGHWPLVAHAWQARGRLAALLTRQPEAAPRTPLPRPQARIEAAGLSLIPPGGAAPVLRNLAFAVGPGQAVGVIGPSGSGKSSLARALTGLWMPAAGDIRLDGATLDQYGADTLGRLAGYLPQRVTLFDGTIAENIARLGAPDPEAVVAAARRAAAHEMILRLPAGYDTPVAAIGGRLSGGQIQRIGLARAMYGDPVFLVLDEPNSNLDNDGTMALNAGIRAVKAAGGTVFIMAHRPAAIQECELLLVIEDGLQRAFGPRDTVLREMVKNHTDIVRAGAAP